MLTKISIQGFKSIYNIRNLELGHINVFIGANGSGKSNLLEAVGLLSAAVSGRVDSESLSRRGVRLSPPELYKTNLQKKEAGETINFEVDGEWDDAHVTYEVLLNNPDFGSDTWKYEAEKIAQDGQLISNDSPVSLMVLEGASRNMRAFLREYVIYSPTTPVLRGAQPDMAPRNPLGLWGGRLAEAVEDILDLENETLGKLDLDEVLDLLDWVDSFTISSPSRELLSSSVPSLRRVVQFKDYWMGKKRDRISGYDASEGSLYMLFMLVLALHPLIPAFFAVDNFDQALNPRLARALTRLFCRIIVDSDPSRQVLLTTHNPLVLDGLDLRDDRVHLFAVERTRSTGGATKVSRVKLSKKVLKTAENGTPLSQMWVMGLLGGVPDIF